MISGPDCQTLRKISFDNQDASRYTFRPFPASPGPVPRLIPEPSVRKPDAVNRPRNILMRNILHYRHFSAAWIALAILSLFAAGCEQGSSSSPGSGHDFGLNDPDICLAMGDSITSGEENPGPTYPQLLEAKLGKRVINRGRGGSTTLDGRAATAGAVAAHRPGFVLILYGVNDIIHGRPIEDATENLRAILQTAKAGQSIPLLATLTPVGNNYRIYAGEVSALNDNIRRLAAEEGIALVDLESAFGWNMVYLLEDGLHPNDEGNERIAAMFYNKLR